MADAPQCSYRSIPRCRETAVGEIPQSWAHEAWAHEAWPLCEQHIQPGMHPPGLRGKLVRYETAEAGTDGA